MRTYLQRRNGTYYFRCRIPTKYQPFFDGKREFKLSLLQKSTRTVLRLSNTIESLIKELFMLLDHSDTFSAHALVSSYLNQIKAEIDNNYFQNNRTDLPLKN